MRTSITVDGRTIEVKVGSRVFSDTNKLTRALIPGDSFTPLRLECNGGGPIKSVACRVDITGGVIFRKNGCDVIRVRMIMVGDGEPDTYWSAYMLAD